MVGEGGNVWNCTFCVENNRIWDSPARRWMMPIMPKISRTSADTGIWPSLSEKWTAISYTVWQTQMFIANYSNERLLHIPILTTSPIQSFNLLNYSFWPCRNMLFYCVGKGGYRPIRFKEILILMIEHLIAVPLVGHTSITDNEITNVYIYLNNSLDRWQIK